MAEHERRVEDAITSAKKMETRLKAAAEDKKKLQKVEEAAEEKEMAATFRVPVQVTEEDTLLSWSVESRQEVSQNWLTGLKCPIVFLKYH